MSKCTLVQDTEHYIDPNGAGIALHGWNKCPAFDPPDGSKAAFSSYRM